MITLDNLTQRQQLLADLIWACTTREQAVALVRSLQGQDRLDAGAIMQCMVFEALEERIGDYTDAAAAAISHARYS